MSRLHVLLMQLPVPGNLPTNVPLAAGYLKAYAFAQGLLDRVTIDILPRALADYAGDALLVDSVVAQHPDVLGISLYTWNSERSLDVARRIKERLPHLIVVVGGPEVQRDNDWVLHHPAVNIAVLGEGEQTFAELLQLLAETKGQGNTETKRQGDKEISLSLLPPVSQSPSLPVSQSPSLPVSQSFDPLASVSGIAFRDASGDLVFTPERVPLSDLSVVPSPYLLGYLELPPEGMLMVEISRWCPYSCSFCLYGRNMGPRLGNRYFPLERILEEIRWGRERNAASVHFIEANLNLVPVFWPLVRALADLNADGQLALYAELRGEHLSEEMVEALCQAGLRVAEVGLQTANLVALRAAHRKTDLQKWAAGTRRLIHHGVEVYLDVILGLPADDAAGVAETLDFIKREDLGNYDIFTLQVLPGTAVRREEAAYSLVHQDHPPYYVLGTDQLTYDALRSLRQNLKREAGFDPDEVEGCPTPRVEAFLKGRTTQGNDAQILQSIWLLNSAEEQWQVAQTGVDQLANHVDVVAHWNDAHKLATLLAPAIAANPSTLFDCYLVADEPPDIEALRVWRAALPYQPGYLDRVAIYRRAVPEPDHDRVSPRLWLVLPWTAQAEPEAYADVAAIIWAYDLQADEEPPLSAWATAGGAGIWVRGRTREEVAAWQERTDQTLWFDAVCEHNDG